MKPKAAISWSGGKDCCLAMLRAWDDVDIVAMVTMFNEQGERSRSHGLRPALVAAQAARLELHEFSARCSWDSYTDEYIATLARLAERGITHVVFGDMGDDIANGMSACARRTASRQSCRSGRNPRISSSASSSRSAERPGSSPYESPSWIGPGWD